MDQALPVQLRAESCQVLAEHQAFGEGEGAQMMVGLGSAGAGVESCVLDVRADNPFLNQASLRVMNCPPEARVSLPFAREGDAWTLDLDGLARTDNGSCFQSLAQLEGK